ncbi:hypothetical protein RRF57_004443 [Xylaria bambusicola]|uniref:Uncharacterized protein n=1 Tax=Xylaria bambusicola TaxID=326684 RepID=A0AAN7UJ79_9PEZI
MKVDVKADGCSGIAVIGAVTVKTDRGSRGLVWVVAAVLRGGGRREETLGGAFGGDVLDVLDAFQVCDDDGEEWEEDGGDVVLVAVVGEHGGDGFVL